MSKDNDKPPFDLQQAYRWLAADAFNRAWELIDKPDRTPDEEEELIHRAHASRWLWGQFTGCRAENLAIGDWQLARVYALAKRPDEARVYAQRALNRAIAAKLVPFNIGYGYEALARAELIAGNLAAFDNHMAAAREQVARMVNPKAKEQIEADLNALDAERKRLAPAHG